MSVEKSNSPKKGSDDQRVTEKAELDQPEWADGLRQLYNSVVDEPLPDSFKDLLSKLDDEGSAATDGRD